MGKLVNRQSEKEGNYEDKEKPGLLKEQGQIHKEVSLHDAVWTDACQIEPLPLSYGHYFAVYRLTSMSRICQLSGKSAVFGNSRSHSNIASKRRQNVNLQVVRINGKRMRIAARTLRTIKKYVTSQHGAEVKV